MEKKQAITILASIETYENLVSFQTIEELNEAVRAYKEQFADQLNKNQLAVLHTLHNYSSKFLGVSFRTKKHIAEDLDISRRTVIRACQYLESLGIIKQLEMKRKEDVSQSMRMKLQTTFDSKVINESFKNARNIARKAAEKFNLLADTDVFHNILANASAILFSKTREYEHDDTLMRNPIGYFTRTFKHMVYDYIDSFREIHNLANRKNDISARETLFLKVIGESF
ncbi:cytosolic protein [Bacillus cereus]|uniref:Cytosolic protein n=1 Tax=Bacillus cereus TaxID=1396 RepID=A0A9X6YL75_BACCE|nr:helix-turn-helix domain-containing protein [Bacillus cereus]PEN91518.1 cytosolic protein [Bacillus cereus]